ncbi:MAG: response regulator [Pseudomonadota bacterium]
MTHTKLILIVDDEAANRILLEAILDCMGYMYRSAGDGFEALACLSPEFDLILLDVMMPGLNGFEVAQRIRNGDSCQDIPIIMVTGLNTEEDRRAALQAGANAFVTKPIDRRELGLSISSLLDA